MMKAPGSDSAIQAALAGVMRQRARQRLIRRQVCWSSGSTARHQDMAWSGAQAVK